MSVINKMLRDLDARRGDAAAGRPRQIGLPAMAGTASVLMPASRRDARWWWVALLLAVAGASAYWYLETELVSTSPVSPPMAADPPALAPVPAASAPEPASSAPAQPVAVVANAVPAAVEPRPPLVGQAMVNGSKPQSAPVGIAATPGAPAMAQKDNPIGKPALSPVPNRASPASSPAITATAPAAAGPATAGESPLRRQSLAQETLAQAQLLWNAGSRESAIELVREAVAVVERSQPVDVALLAQLVREQTRMELAQGRPSAVLALLSRLEPVLSGQADLWAVRGNAAQRLGRHQESVQFYHTALQLRPGEARWMLGAAVSLAALGQLDAAARQAEQARALGPVSPEVLAYLRQAGVPLR